MGIDETSLALLDDFAPLGDERKRGDGHDQAQTAERLRTTDEGRFQLKPMGFIIQKFSSISNRRPYSSQVLPSVGSSLSTYHTSVPPCGRATARCTGPSRFTVMHTRCQKPACPRATARRSTLQRGRSSAIQPEAGLDPDAPVPAEPGQMRHQVGIGKAPVGQKDDRTYLEQRQPPWRAGPCRCRSPPACSRSSTNHTRGMARPR